VRSKAQGVNDVESIGMLLSEVEPERVEWLWPGRLPIGKLYVLDGDPGLEGGKRTRVHEATRRRLAKALKVRPHELEDSLRERREAWRR
jgi:hypothetical protein